VISGGRVKILEPSQIIAKNQKQDNQNVYAVPRRGLMAYSPGL